MDKSGGGKENNCDNNISGDIISSGSGADVVHLQQQQHIHNNLSRYRFNHHPFLPSLTAQQTMQMMMMSSESEENNSGSSNNNTTTAATVLSMDKNEAKTTTATGQPHKLQKQNSNMSSGCNTTSSSSVFSANRLVFDDEDPVFSLDEEVMAKAESGERTRHYTADFDPTASDDEMDDLVKDAAGKLHGGRAYSVTHRFPPRTRHSGRSGASALPTVLSGHAIAFGNQSQQQQQHRGCAGAVGVPASLPIAINRHQQSQQRRAVVGFVPPSLEQVVGGSSLSEEEESGSAGGMAKTDKMDVLQQQPLRFSQQSNAMATTANAAADKMTTTAMLPPSSRFPPHFHPLALTRAASTAGAIVVEKQRKPYQQQQQQQQLFYNSSEREDDVSEMFGRIQAYSRSIQPADDPERLFGERPRRCYQQFLHNAGSSSAINTEVDNEKKENDGGGGVAGGVGDGAAAVGAATASTTVAHAGGGVGGRAATAAGRGAAGGSVVVPAGGGGTPRIIVPTSLRGAVW